MQLKYFIVFRVKRDLDEEIRLLRPFIVVVRPDLTFTVTVEMHCTMIDGKVLNILTGTASNTCGLCLASPILLKQTALHMNTRRFRAKPQNCVLGLHPLHGKIKFFYQFYKVGCNKPIWDKKEKNKDAARALKADRKKEIQDAFAQEGFRVDMPNQYGTGNTVNGNLCSELFHREELMAEVLGIDRDLVHRFQ